MYVSEIKISTLVCLDFGFLLAQTQANLYFADSDRHSTMLFLRISAR